MHATISPRTPLLPVIGLAILAALGLPACSGDAGVPPAEEDPTFAEEAPDAAEEELSAAEEDPGLIRELQFANLVMGAFGGEEFEGTIPRVEREFWLFEQAEGGEAVGRLPEANTLAGRAGPCFFITHVAPDGRRLFERTAWLEIRARPLGEEGFRVLEPRLRLDPGERLLGLTEHRVASAGDMRAWLPCLPIPTCMLLRDYPARSLQGPGTIAAMLETVMGMRPSEAEVQEVVRKGLERDGLSALPEPRRFDATRWRAVRDDEPWDMVQDLLNRHELAGMTRAEVEELLGEPSPPGFPHGAKHWDMVYRVGFTFMDSWWLFLALDDDGRVSMMRLYED